MVVVLQDMAHLRGVGDSQGAAEGGSLLAQVGILQQGDRTSATEGWQDITVWAHYYNSDQELLKHIAQDEPVNTYRAQDLEVHSNGDYGLVKQVTKSVQAEGGEILICNT